MEAPTIDTVRLMIHPFSVSDVDEFVTELTSKSGIMKNLSEECRTPAEQKECATLYIKDYSSTWQPHHYGGWAVCDRGGDIAKKGKLLGFYGFGSGQIDDAGPELAFAYGRSHTGARASLPKQQGLVWTGYFTKAATIAAMCAITPGTTPPRKSSTSSDSSIAEMKICGDRSRRVTACCRLTCSIERPT